MRERTKREETTMTNPNENMKAFELNEGELARVSAGSGTDTDSRRRPGDGTADGT